MIVNGFGRMDSDLDVILYAQPDKFTYNRELSPKLSGKRSKNIASDHLSELANYMRQHEHNFSQLEPILGARVPIIKYYDNYLQLDVDLSMSAVLVENHFYYKILLINQMQIKTIFFSRSGIYMSELFYFFGEIDHRVRPLVFCIRYWAKHARVIQSYPAQSLSNFGLTCLIIFFLQQLKRPILPSIDYVQAIFDRNGTLNGYSTGHKDFKFKTENTDTIATLLRDFFKYYAEFDYVTNGMSMHTSKVFEKRLKRPHIYVVNPIDPQLNATKIVDTRNCKLLQKKMKTALSTFESQLSRKDVCDNQHWGIIPLFTVQSKKVNNTSDSV